jgi:hypothetical protein
MVTLDGAVQGSLAAFTAVMAAQASVGTVRASLTAS